MVYNYAHKLVFPFWKHFINKWLVYGKNDTILGNTIITFHVSFLTDLKKEQFLKSKPSKNHSFVGIFKNQIFYKSPPN